MLIDTHAHLNFNAYKKDLEEVISRCRQQPMAVINVGAQLATSQKAVELTKEKNFYAAIAQHPIHVFDEPFKLTDYQSLINDKVVAIGETGLDYWHFKHLREPFKIVMVHGWGGSPEERFFVWLDKQLSKDGHQVVRCQLPNVDNPQQKKWLQAIRQQAGSYFNTKTIFVGFSLGGVAILRLLEELDDDYKVGGVFLLGTPIEDLGYREISNFFQKDLSWPHLKKVINNSFIYSSTNDEVVPLEHGQKLAKDLNGQLQSIDGAWHFNIDRLPELYHDIKEIIDELKNSLPSISQMISKQKKVFKLQLHLAKVNNLPVILHGRNGLEGYDVYQEMLEMLKQEKIDRGVFHFYSGDLNIAQKIAKTGFYLGFDGPLTFKNATELHQLAAEIPLDKILAETDCPFIAPEPYRGQRNEPAYVKEVVKKIAELKNESYQLVEGQLWQNARQLFLEGA